MKNITHSLRLGLTMQTVLHWNVSGSYLAPGGLFSAQGLMPLSCLVVAEPGEQLGLGLPQGRQSWGRDVRSTPGAVLWLEADNEDAATRVPWSNWSTCGTFLCPCRQGLSSGAVGLLWRQRPKTCEKSLSFFPGHAIDSVLGFNCFII